MAEHEHSNAMHMEGPPFMSMWFHTKVQDTVLFKTWNITDVGSKLIFSHSTHSQN